MLKSFLGRCHGRKKGKKKPGQDTILLMGLPNVGKSVVFSTLTGMDVMVSNYAGTTVEYAEGKLNTDSSQFILKDAPGVYNIAAARDQAEKVAVNMLRSGPSAVICVLDATNLESSMHLLFQVLEYNIPTVALLNKYDLAQKRNISINHSFLEKVLGIPVIPTVAITGEGFKDLHKRLLEIERWREPSLSIPQRSNKDRWENIEGIISKAVTVKPFTANKKQDLLIKPWPGIPIAIGIIMVMFALVIGLGMGLRRFVLLPFFTGVLFPGIENIVNSLIDQPVLRNILIGEYGFLIKGIEWPFALVLPYVISFYMVLSILEDSGYLPRLGVLMEGVFSKIGLNGSCVIPILLGYGCGIPAIMSTRSLSSRKIRIIVSQMVCFAVPCVSQTGAFIALLSERSLFAFAFIFLISIMAMIAIGFVLNKVIKNPLPYTLTELPQLLVPRPRILSKKILMRVKRYILDGAVPMMIAVIFASLLYELGFLAAAGDFLAPLISGWLNMPMETAVPLILGIVRRELTVLPLIDMNLTTIQFLTGAVVALFYVPCIAMIATMAKEFGIKIAIATLFATTLVALFLGGLVARGGNLLLMVFS